MNIFYLSRDVKQCAEWHVDKHVVKMILEYAQLLSTAHHVLGDPVPQLYKATHVNHPCAKWVRESSENYQWLYDLFIAVQNEYTYRYEKVHKSSQLNGLLGHYPKSIPYRNFTLPPQCMPDDCKCIDPIRAYRKYYMNHKLAIASWKHRQDPPWFRPAYADKA